MNWCLCCFLFAYFWFVSCLLFVLFAFLCYKKFIVKKIEIVFITSFTILLIYRNINFVFLCYCYLVAVMTKCIQDTSKFNILLVRLAYANDFTTIIYDQNLISKFLEERHGKLYHLMSVLVALFVEFILCKLICLSRKHFFVP